MAVVTIYMSDRDPAKLTFVSKKDADEYDKKLELAENLATFLSQRVDFLSEAQAETLGRLMADHKELLANAMKGKPEILLEAELPVAAQTETASAKEKRLNNVTAIAG